MQGRLTEEILEETDKLTAEVLQGEYKLICDIKTNFVDLLKLFRNDVFEFFLPFSGEKWSQQRLSPRK